MHWVYDAPYTFNSAPFGVVGKLNVTELLRQATDGLVSILGAPWERRVDLVVREEGRSLRCQHGVRTVLLQQSTRHNGLNSCDGFLSLIFFLC